MISIHIYNTSVILKRQGLYYDGNTGIYYYYDEASKTYQFHSQVQICTNEATNMHLPATQMEERESGKVDKVTILQLIPHLVTHVRLL